MSDERKIAIQLSGVKKRYRLGQIGGGTLTADLQSWWARVRGKDDPNMRIDQDQRLIGKSFMALNGIDLTIYQGEAIGIIGSNGAGKSTMLKLLSRVTAPTAGEIDIYGRVASMLEVGTGFHGEMTGRENVYLNGAILGMTKAEIDAKMEDIIEFSEVREFIDTPVKRYSSGMYVKLAFSVAAHLDSEIMIMDEVLAVGDMAFQKKCLSKMRDAAKEEGRTVLYVSHNMNTIRQLCDRCVVLDKGRIVFDGDVEEAISLYLGLSSSPEQHYIYNREHHKNLLSTDKFVINELYINHDNGFIFSINDTVSLTVKIDTKQRYNDVRFRLVITYRDGSFAGTMLSANSINIERGIGVSVNLSMSLKALMPGMYRVDLIAFLYDEFGHESVIDGVYPGFFLEIDEKITEKNPIMWLHQYWGHIRLEDITVSVNE